MTKYDILNLAGALALLLFNLSRFSLHQSLPYGTLRTWASGRRETGHNDLLSKDVFWVLVSIVLISAVQYGPAPIVNTLFGSLMKTGANYFGVLLAVPVLMLLYCHALGLDPARQIDIVVPAFPLALTFAKFGCYTAGCCSGISLELEQFQAFSHIHAFPIQLLEAAVAFGLFLFFLKNQERMKPGTAYPIYLMLYCGTRFFTEFLRSEGNILWIFKKYHFLCMGGFLLGFIAYRLILRLRKEHP